MNPYVSPEFRRHLYVVPDREQEDAFDQDDGLGCIRGCANALKFVLLFGGLCWVVAMLARYWQ